MIDLSVEVAGTPEEVWTAIATGPGITAWFVPTTVEERVGGATTSKFGEGPEMLIPGRVAAWQPPRRLVFDGGEEEPGLAYEWLVETNAKGSCVVRLVNSGFVEGTPWDDQYDGLLEGWGLFMFNLQLHLAHFAGREATSMLPMTMWVMPVEQAWPRLLADLGLPAVPVVGERDRRHRGRRTAARRHGRPFRAGPDRPAARRTGSGDGISRLRGRTCRRGRPGGGLDLAIPL